MIKINDFSFSAFLRMTEILDTDQYKKVISKNKDIVNGDLIQKKERTEEFIFELYRQIVSELSGLPRAYTMNDTFVYLSINELTGQYIELKNLMTKEPDFSELENDCFELGDKLLIFEGFKNWTFNKWVIFENAIKGKFEENNGVLKKVERGEKFVLPVCFGEWFDNMPDLGAKFSLFNDDLAARDVIPVFGRVNGLINLVKKNHSFIYTTDDSDDGKSKAYKLHVDSFGWQETLRDLAEKRVFGDYLQTKKAPMLEVLEFLNCSISKEVAQSEDFISNSK